MSVTDLRVKMRTRRTWQLNVLLVNEDLVTLGTELLFGEEVDGLSGLG